MFTSSLGISLPLKIKACLSEHKSKMKKNYSVILLFIVFAIGIGVGDHLKLLTIVNKTPSPVTQPLGYKLITQTDQAHIYQITTTSTSYFARDSNGALIPEQRHGQHFYKVREGKYSFQRTLVSNKTALIVMDPWADSGSSFLNKYYEPIIRNKLMPLVHKAIQLNIPVFVLTNDPKRNPTDYASHVFPELQKLANRGDLMILYHQDFDDRQFSKYLTANSIDTLIYSGFASNMCVIGRRMGMIPMQLQGFRLFFVPEASAAVEFGDSWKTGAAHRAATSFISQWVGELINLKNFMKLSPEKSLN